jgi:small-conductance mechanosensitive channel
VFLGLLIKVLLLLIIGKRTVEPAHFSFFRSLLTYLGGPLTYLLPLFLFNLLLPVMRVPKDVSNLLDRSIEIVMIILFAWSAIRLSELIREYVLFRYDIKKTDNLRERKIRTQLQFIHRIFMSLVVIVAIGAILLSFDTLRKVGAGLLTGVGIGGIIIGFAAQRSLANLLAGFQIAFTQPLRIDDEVVVEGEFGNIEEITLTYVVVKIWDERRLILPINYFIEKPFQNWTRTSTQLQGSVFFYLDYSIPVEPLREELSRLLKQTPLWDGRTNDLKVTNATDKTIEVRALVSATDSGRTFDLRCHIREKMIAFIKEKYPQALPHSRTELTDTDNQRSF